MCGVRTKLKGDFGKLLNLNMAQRIETDWIESINYELSEKYGIKDKMESGQTNMVECEVEIG